MSLIIEVILNKISHENIEINCRAMSNLLKKIENNLICLEQIDERIAQKFMFSITYWLFVFLDNYQQHKYISTLIINVLNLYLKCIDIFPPSAIINLKNEIELSPLFNNIGSINQELSSLCDQIQQKLSLNELNCNKNACDIYN